MWWYWQKQAYKSLYISATATKLFLWRNVAVMSVSGSDRWIFFVFDGTVTYFNVNWLAEHEYRSIVIKKQYYFSFALFMH